MLEESEKPAILIVVGPAQMILRTLELKVRSFRSSVLRAGGERITADVRYRPTCDRADDGLCGLQCRERMNGARQDFCAVILWILLARVHQRKLLAEQPLEQVRRPNHAPMGDGEAQLCSRLRSRPEISSPLSY